VPKIAKEGFFVEAQSVVLFLELFICLLQNGAKNLNTYGSEFLRHFLAPKEFSSHNNVLTTKFLSKCAEVFLTRYNPNVLFPNFIPTG
jgi:hypothetical protein